MRLRERVPGSRIRKAGTVMTDIIEIFDIDAPELDIYARYNETELKHFCEPDKRGIFVAESPMVIERALDAGLVPLSFLMEKRAIEGSGKNLIDRAGKVPVFTAELPVLNRITGFSLTRGVLCAFRRPPLPDPEELCGNVQRVAVLERVMNPTNVGAIMRSAAALSMDAVLLTPGSADPLYRRAARVSVGTVFQIPWTYIGNTEEDWPAGGIASLKRWGFHTVAMALSDNALRPDDPALAAKDKLAVILGTEGEGLFPETIALCDDTVKIPMRNGVDSLNVAAASAVAFWELGRRQSPSGSKKEEE